jgi:hypothetical protein
MRTSQNVVMEFGLAMPRPIHDLKIDQDAISGTLSFPGGLTQWVIIHWEAVFVIASPVLEKVAVWWADAPDSVQRKMLEVAGETANEKLRDKRPKLGLVKSKPRRKNHLRSIPGGKK